MNKDNDAIRQVFELGETAVNQTDLANRIHANLQTHRLELPADWPSFALNAESAAASSTANVYATIADAVKAYDQIWLEPAIPTSDNSLLARLKRPLHQLTLFYVNKLGQKQIIFNDRLLRAVNSLASLDEEKGREIQALREQMTHLQQRIEALEQKQS
ncbi:MAG: hypothetical protein IPM53_27950 [Anaerolineaceae bacterium]|nr:hypothetical protein [Anaerolineaceae bacterium]